MLLLSHHLQQHVVLLRLRDHSCVSYRDASLNCENVAKQRAIMNLESNGSRHDLSHTKLIPLFLFFAGMEWMDSRGRFISIAARARCLGNRDSNFVIAFRYTKHTLGRSTCQQDSGKGFSSSCKCNPLLCFHSMYVETIFPGH